MKTLLSRASLPCVIVAAIVAAMFATGCRHEVKMTSIAIQDSVRHYYPVVRGQHVFIQYRIANTGKNPLVISEVQPSCGCIVLNNELKVIPPGRTGVLNFTFNSEKNLGEVEHTIRLYGNMLPHGRARASFDLNIVDPSNAMLDYEEIHNATVERNASIEQLVDGTESEKGYYVDPAVSSHSSKRYPWREKGLR